MKDVINLIAFNSLIYENQEEDFYLSKEILNKKINSFADNMLLFNNEKKSYVKIDGYDLSLDYIYNNILENLTTILFEEFKKSNFFNQEDTNSDKDHMEQSIRLFFDSYIERLDKDGIFYELFLNYYNITKLSLLKEKL